MPCLKWQKLNLNFFQIPTCIYEDVEFLIFLINIAEPTIFKILWSRIRIKHITYLDMNNLYGYAMSKFLPTGGFKWIDPKEFDLNKYTTNHSKGHVLEFDHEYPKKLHELHNNYPLSPHKIEIKREMVSEYQLKIADLHNIPIRDVRKIVPNFLDKERYVIHYENVQLYLRQGLK